MVRSFCVVGLSLVFVLVSCGLVGATLNITVVTNEGVVLAADSRVIYQNEKGDYRIATDSAFKVFQIGQRAGLVSAGKTNIGDMSLATLLNRFKDERRIDRDSELPVDLISNQLVGFLKEEHEVAKERIGKRLEEINSEISSQVDEETRKLLDGERRALQRQIDELRSTMGLIVSGYDNREIRRVYQVIVSDQESFIGELGTVEPTVFWDGQTDVVSRLILGFDPVLLKEATGLRQDDEVLDRLEYNIHFDKMTLKDAIEFAIFMVETTIRMQRFADGTAGNPGGVSGTGGTIDVAVITPKGFRWVQRKGVSFLRDYLEAQ